MIALCLMPPIARAGLVDRVLVIRNMNSPVSQAVANDYMVRRGATHVLDIRVQDAAASFPDETMTYKDFEITVEQPLRAYLESHPGIDFILMTKGVPIRLVGAQKLNSSLDSYVAALDYDRIPGAIHIESADPSLSGWSFRGESWANRYWNSGKPFSHAEFGGYLVTRLDGYTQADAIGLTTHALAAEALLRAGRTPTGQILLDQDPDYGVGDPELQPYSVIKASPPVDDTTHINHESEWKDWNADLALAADSLREHHRPYLLDTTEIFQGCDDDLMGYASWGSNDRHFLPDTYYSLTFAPGGIAETAVSYSGRTFLPTQGGQSLAATLIHSGISGVKGYVDEPLLQAIASPSILFSRYTAGWTLAESFYAASNEVGWEDIVIGDPILRAYPLATGLEQFYASSDPSGETTRIEPRVNATPDTRSSRLRQAKVATFEIARPGSVAASVSALGRRLPPQ